MTLNAYHGTVCSLTAALLLILSFPKFSFSWLAWIAFVPIFCLSARLERVRDAFSFFYLTGFLFFFASVEWLRHVTYFGWVFVAFLYAFYFGLFGVVFCSVWKSKQRFAFLFLIPSAWAVLEWVRTEIPVWGFGWNLLAYSQTSNLGIARIAAFVGAFGVSWLVMFVNVGIFFVVQFLGTRYRRDRFGGPVPSVPGTVGTGALVVILASSFFLGRGNEPTVRGDEIRLAVIQGNIAQDVKWDPGRKAEILETHLALTRFVGHDKPELILWPEAAFPGYFNLDPKREEILKFQKELNVPMVLGSPYLDVLGGSYNSVFLVERGSGLEARYDKVRLVPFGEYVPWRPFFGMFGLERLADSLGVGDYRAGEDVSVFVLENSKRFSPLICFEDTFPSLARRAVERGAQFLVVLTNDAWFSKSAAAYQHLQASIFRAIENGVPVVRAANTGVSAFVSFTGEVVDRVEDTHRHDTFVAGGLVRTVLLPRARTVYQQGGHLFPLFCLFVLIVSFAIVSARTRGRQLASLFFALFVFSCPCFSQDDARLHHRDLEETDPSLLVHSGVLEHIKPEHEEPLREDEWVELKGDHFNVYLKTRDFDLSQKVLVHAEENLGRILKRLDDDGPKRGWQEDGRVRIFIFENQEMFQQKRGAPSWAAGDADYGKKLITTYLGSRHFFSSTLPHEVAHLVLYELTGEHRNVPTWLHEGFALAQEDEEREDLNRAVKLAAAQGKLLPLKLLTIVDPKQQTRGAANVYYGESQAFVRYLIETYGASRFRSFILYLAKGKSFEEAIGRAYAGVLRSLEELETKFFERLA